MESPEPSANYAYTQSKPAQFPASQCHANGEEEEEEEEQEEEEGEEDSDNDDDYEVDEEESADEAEMINMQKRQQNRDG